MTNAEQPEIIRRLENVDAQLDQIGDELDLIRTIQNGIRQEVRTNSQTIARLERVVNQLADIAHDHQVGLRIAQRDAERDRQALRIAQQDADRDAIGRFFKTKLDVFGNTYFNRAAMAIVHPQIERYLAEIA